MPQIVHCVRTFFEWTVVKFLRACSRSRLFSLAVSSAVSCAFWLFFWTSPHFAVLPLLISLSFTTALTLHGVSTLFMSFYRPVVCSVRLSVNEEVTLVYRSWWPRGLTVDEIKLYAVESATESARLWYTTNDKASPKLFLSTDEAVLWTEEYLTGETINNSNDSCPICLERFTGDSRTLKVCHHRYCLDCISTWFARGRLFCPYCRSDHSVCIPTEVWNKRVDISSPSISVTSVDIINDTDE